MKNIKTATAIFMLALFAAVSASAALPDGYVELRAIQGDGTSAYIATGYIPKPNIDRIEAKFRIDVRTGANSTLFCSRIVTTAAINAWTIFSNLTTLGMRFDYLNNKDNFKTGFTNGQMVELSVSSNVVTFADGSTLVSGNPYDPYFTEAGSQMFLFGANQNASTAVSNWSKDILYSFKVYRNDVLIHDYVPAKRSSDGKIGLYDVVDDVFFTNASPYGSFTEYYADPFYLKGSDAGGTSSMSGLGSCAGWTNAVGAARTAAVAYEDYVVDNGFTIREPAVNYDYTFPGASLTVVKGVVGHGGEAGKKLTIGDLRVPEGGACNLSRSGSSRNLAWGGNYSIAEGGVLSFLLYDNNYTNSVSASVSGSGTLRFEANRGTLFSDVLFGDLSSFTGSIEMRGQSILEFASAASIPGNPPAGTTSSVVVTNGATLIVDQDWRSGSNRVWDFGSGATPSIYVAAGKAVTIYGEVRGSVGFKKTGPGTLVLVHPSPSLSGVCVVADGKVVLRGGAVELKRLFRRLPVGYTEREFVKGPGDSCRIVTDYIPQPNRDRIEALVEWPKGSLTRSMAIWCARYNGNDRTWTLFALTNVADEDIRFRFDYGSVAGTRLTPAIVEDVKYSVVVASNVFSFVSSAGSGGQTHSKAADFTPGPVVLFASYISGDPAASPNNFGTHRLYSFKVWRSGELIRDFVPASRDSDSNCGVYDRVAGRFYSSIGAFTAGDACAGYDPAWIEVQPGFAVYVH